MRPILKRIMLPATGIAFAISMPTAEAGLIGTQLSIETLYQQTSVSAPITIGFLTTAIVQEPGVEFPSLAATEVNNPPIGLQVVDVAINAGNDFLEIDFDNVKHTSFSTGYFNGYVFTFDSSSAISFTAASIDNSVTTLGLKDTDISFSGNKLFVNVEGLSFNRSTFARINLTSVPLPTSAWFFGSSVMMMVFRKKSSKKA